MFLIIEPIHLLPTPYFCNMKYEPGDEIIVLHTKETGKVLEIISNQMVLIEVRGVQFPAYMDQIDFPYFHRFTEKKAIVRPAPKQYIDQLPKEKKSTPPLLPDEGLWLFLLPVYELDDFNDEVISAFKIYIHNKNNQAYRFTYNQFIDDHSVFELDSQVHPHKDFYLHDIAFGNFSDNPVFSFEMEMIQADKTKEPKLLVEKKLRSKQVFKLAEEMRSKNEPALQFELFKFWPDKKIIEHNLSGIAIQTNGSKANKQKSIAPPPRSVIDLHIEKIADNIEGLDNYTILQMQLTEFEKWYDAAIQHHMPNMTVIHGIGSGKLKDELHELLKTKSLVSRFVNQYHPAYGYGATEIYFKY